MNLTSSQIQKNIQNSFNMSGTKLPFTRTVLTLASAAETPTDDKNDAILCEAS